MTLFHDLIETWREEAELFRRRGLTQPAAMADSYADDLERAIRHARHETVNLREGAELSGYSPDSLGRLIREGKIENVGKKNAPRIRVMDLPRKAGKAVVEARGPA